jgi:putative thioredoxin
MDDIIELNHNHGEEFVYDRSEGNPLILNFWAPWCDINDTFRPVLEDVADDYDVGVIHVNVKEKPGIAETFNVRGVPVVKCVYDTEVLGEFAGALPEIQVREFVDETLESVPEGSPAESS